MSLWEVMLSIFWFMLLVAWFWVLIAILTDVFRDEELSGWGKAGWCLFVIVIPWLGVLVYLLARGKSMGERSMRVAADNERQFRAYVQQAAGSGSGVADELSRLADLHQQGALSAEDYELAKRKVLSQGGVDGAPGPAPRPPASSARRTRPDPHATGPGVRAVATRVTRGG